MFERCDSPEFLKSINHIQTVLWKKLIESSFLPQQNPVCPRRFREYQTHRMYDVWYFFLHFSYEQSTKRR